MATFRDAVKALRKYAKELEDQYYAVPPDTTFSYAYNLDIESNIHIKLLSNCQCSCGKTF